MMENSSRGSKFRSHDIEDPQVSNLNRRPPISGTLDGIAIFRF